jgi:DNA mismatch endonuclease (patch repair protein)
MERSLRKKLPGGKFENVSTAHSGRMRAIKEKGNKSTEIRMRALLVRGGVRGWKLHPKGLPGKPDFLFTQARLILFVDGCYWHGCPQCGHVPNVNRPYWSAKIKGNQRRDRENTRKLQEAGYRVLRVWEHELLAGTAGPWLETLKGLLSR